jgi:hypothetical protein
VHQNVQRREVHPHQGSVSPDKLLSQVKAAARHGAAPRQLLEAGAKPRLIVGQPRQPRDSEDPRLESNPKNKKSCRPDGPAVARRNTAYCYWLLRTAVQLQSVWSYL